MSSRQKNNAIKKYLFVFSVVFVAGIVFLKSFYWPVMGEKRKLAICGLTAFFVFLIPVLSIRISRFNVLLERMGQNFELVIDKLKERKRKYTLILSMFLASIGLAYILSNLVSRFIFRTVFNVRLFYTIVTVFVLVLCIWFLWKSASKKTETIFIVVALIIGLFCVGVIPDRVGVSWDDEIHYRRTLEVSNFLNGIMYKADEKNINDYATNIYQKVGYDQNSNYSYTEELNKLYEVRECNIHEFSEYGSWTIAYLPGAIGIILGRGLGLSYAGVFNLGRISNLIMYVLLIYFAVKRLKYGKVLVAAIGLLPTTIFMAVNYSYDPWVTGFIILGFSYFFAELQDDKPLENKNIFIMVGAIVMGCLPKAIYFPLFLPLFFLPQKKFKTLKQRRCFYFVIIGMVLFLVATFMMPMIISGPGMGDARGGADVNSTEQVIFVLQNPLRYLRILLNFLRDYLSLGNISFMLQKFAYVGDGYYYGIVYLILTFVAILDRGENERNNVWIKYSGFVGALAAVILSATAMYISFTPVASDTVGGMQGRYIIPIMFPVLYLIGMGTTTHKIDKNAFVCVPLALIALTFVYNMYEFCVLVY